MTATFTMLSTGCGGASETTKPLDRSAGSIRWRVEGIRGFGRPSTCLGNVFVTTIDHSVIAFDVRTGGLRWRTQLPSQRPSLFGQGSVCGDSIVVVGDEDLFGLDALTGRIRWQFSASAGRNPGLFLPTLTDGKVVAGSSSGHVFALALRSGNELWRTRLVSRDTVSVFQPVVAGERVFVSFTVFGSDASGADRGGLASLDILTGRTRWIMDLPSTVPGVNPTATIEPAYASGVVAAGARDGPIYAFSATDGALLWMQPPVVEATGSPPVVRDYRPLAASGGLIVIGTTGSALIAATATDGRIRWNFPQTFGSTGWVSTVGDDVFLTYGGGQLDVIDIRSGALRWRSERQVSSFSPAVTDSTVVTSGDGVTAFRRW